MCCSRCGRARGRSSTRAQLDEKFNRLEKDFGILCELEDSIISFGFIIQALMQQGGEVKKPQLDENGELVLELKAVKVLSFISQCMLRVKRDL